MDPWFQRRFSKAATESSAWESDYIPVAPTWISNHTLSKVWEEITYPFLNFNGATVEV